jgi:excisionase family DNA binding protein
MTRDHTEMPSIVLDMTEAADSLRVSRSTLKRLIGEGKLGTVRIGRRVLLKRSALEAFVQAGGTAA